MEEELEASDAAALDAAAEDMSDGGAAAANEDIPSKDELKRLTIPVLKTMCQSKGLRVGGRKPEIIHRLLNPNADGSRPKRQG